MLTTFCFNADWRLQPPEEAMPPPSGGGSLTTSMATTESRSTLVNSPHPNIMMIGLHGLMYAFGVGYAAQYAAEDPLRGHVIGRSNDLNIAALNRVNFPKLQCVRALSRAMLSELNDADGPAEGGVEGGGGMARYDKWWDMLTREGVRLEDCTGALLGTLPTDEEGVDEGEGDEEGEGDGEDDDDDDDEEEEDDEDSDDWEDEEE
ncbi:hypothetical protein H0H93_000395, partial [Arthromyces matolae]